MRHWVRSPLTLKDWGDNLSPPCGFSKKVFFREVKLTPPLKNYLLGLTFVATEDIYLTAGTRTDFKVSAHFG